VQRSVFERYFVDKILKKIYVSQISESWLTFMTMLKKIIRYV